MRRLVPAALVLVALVWPSGAARADSTPTSAASSNVVLLSQTPWLQGHGDFHLAVSLPGAASSDEVQVTVYYQLITRTAFDGAAGGHVGEGYFYQHAAPLAGLGSDGSGGVGVDLPVNQAPVAGAPFPMVQIGETGVFPVQVQVVTRAGVAVGTPLTTFIVFAMQTASAGTLKPLPVALIVPVSSPPVASAAGGLGTPGPAETARLAQLGQVLNADSSVAADIMADPLTLDELAAGNSPADRDALAEYRGATVGGPFELLPAPYSPVPLGTLQDQLPGEVGRQLTTGAATLHSVFAVSPDQSTWVVDGPLDSAALGVLVAHHARQIIVPNADLAPLSGEIQITFAGATYLYYGGTQIRVIAADSTLMAAFVRPEPPVLAANELLAEMAMIYTEAPNAISQRGLALLPPAGWSASPAFVQTMLAGLQGNPLVSAVTASQLFAAIGSPESDRELSANQASSPDLPQVGRIAGDRRRIDDLGRVLGRSAELSSLDKQLLLAESPGLSGTGRERVLAAIEKETGQVQHAVSLPPASSITLTSTKGQIPLTILTTANLHPRIQLELRSQRLIFRAFHPKEGRCTVVTETKEICLLSITSQNTTLNVPVETRSSGVFPIDVWLEVPGTGQALAHDQDTVRSTAVSGVAVIVIVVALAGLVLWWGRDLRRGRRPKGMVPSPIADSGPPVVDLGGSVTPMSPSRAGTGPSPTTDIYDPTREMRQL